MWKPYDFGEEAGPGRDRPPGPRKKRIRSHREMESSQRPPFGMSAGEVGPREEAAARKLGIPVIEVISEEEKAERRRKRKRKP